MVWRIVKTVSWKEYSVKKVSLYGGSDKNWNYNTKHNHLSNLCLYGSSVAEPSIPSIHMDHNNTTTLLLEGSKRPTKLQRHTIKKIK